MTTKHVTHVPFIASCSVCDEWFSELDECYEHTTDTGHTVEAITDYEIITYKGSQDVERVQPLTPGSAAIATSGRGDNGLVADRPAPAAFSTDEVD